MNQKLLVAVATAALFFGSAIQAKAPQTTSGGDSTGIIEENGTAESPAVADTATKKQPESGSIETGGPSGTCPHKSKDRKSCTKKCKMSGKETALSVDVRKMKDDAQKLREEAAELTKSARELEKAVDSAESSHDNISGRTSELSDSINQAIEAMKRELALGPGADSAYIAKKKAFIAARREVMERIQSHAMELGLKTREMARKAREMAEEADRREDLADDMDSKAAKISEEQDKRPMTQRYKLRFGFGWSLSSVPKDKVTDDYTVFAIHGLTASYSFLPFLDAGLHDIMFYSTETVYGSRYALSVSPEVNASVFVLRRMQLGGGIGASVQGQWGADHPAKVGVAPYIELFNQNWIRNHFSLGPQLRFNWAAYNGQFMSSVNGPSVLPQKSMWFDTGIKFNFHF